MGNDSLANTHPNFLSQSKRKILFDSSKCMKHNFFESSPFSIKSVHICLHRLSSGSGRCGAETLSPLNG